MDYYVWLKALHAAAAFAFVGGVLVTTVALGAARYGSGDMTGSLMAIRRWDTRVTTPAMLLVWSLGLALALIGQWLPSGWLIIKLIVVVLLSGLHGVSSGRLRRAAAGEPVIDHAHLSFLVIISAATIAALVIVKPSI